MPAKPVFEWKKLLSLPGPGGIAASEKYVIVADRDPGDTGDVFRCLHAADGTPAWTLRYPAAARFDYGNSARATPLMVDDRVYLFGAAGHLHCVALESGGIVWKKNLRAEFRAKDELPWGMSSSPLLVDGKLIVNPGGPEASLVALDPATGEVIWQTPGGPAAFSSFIVGTFGGKRQIVGYDKTSLGGWDIANGARLWQLIPPRKRDFNVPTPLEFEGQLVVSTENNGTRLYRFGPDGKIDPKPVAQQTDLAPDSHTPTAVGRRLFGVCEGLFCLDLNAGLKTLWTSEDPAFANYATILGSPRRILVTSQEGELVLLDAQCDECRILARLKLFEEDPGVLSHPAIVGSRLFVRNSSAIYCLDLSKP